jgi:hypothetical protein
MDTPKVGDIVRVVLEAKVTGMGGYADILCLEGGEAQMGIIKSIEIIGGGR